MAHTGHMTETQNLHAHLDSATADCDGPMYREYVVQMNDDEKTQEDPEYTFKHRVLEGQVFMHSEFGVTVKVDQDGFQTQEQTDEGYRSVTVRWCTDETCDEEAYSQRDVYAEMMGY